jgi:hypothetical protein
VGRFADSVAGGDPEPGYLAATDVFAGIAGA